MSRKMLDANDRSALLDQLRKRNLNETERFIKLIKSRKPDSIRSVFHLTFLLIKLNIPLFYLLIQENKLFELANVFKNELTEFKIANQKLLQENSELIKSSGTSGASSSITMTSYSIDKMRNMDEQLLKAKDEVIDLQKKLVDVSSYLIPIGRRQKKGLKLFD